MQNIFPEVQVPTWQAIACADPEIFMRGGPTKMVIFGHRREGDPDPGPPPPLLWIRVCHSMPSRYLHRGENVLHYCLFELEITVLLPNYIYSHVTYHVTRQWTAGQAIELSIAWYNFMLLPCYIAVIWHITLPGNRLITGQAIEFSIAWFCFKVFTIVTEIDENNK